MKKNHILLISSIAIFLGIATFIYLRYSSFKNTLVRIAKGEARKWSAITELSAKASGLLVDYWKAAGMSFTPTQMQNPTVQSNYPWSAAFISYVFYSAGAKSKFPYSSAHSGYFQQAKRDRDKKNAPLRGFRISEYAPKVSDLIVYSRQAGKGYDSAGYFPSHGEIVVEVGKGYLKAIGGNVGNKVKISKYTTDENGRITQKEAPFFMVIQNNIK